MSILGNATGWVNHRHVGVVCALSAFPASVRIDPEHILPLLSRWVNSGDLNWCLGWKWRTECQQNRGVCMYVYSLTEFTPSCCWRGVWGCMGNSRRWWRHCIDWLSDGQVAGTVLFYTHYIPKDRSQPFQLLLLGVGNKRKVVLMTSRVGRVCFLWRFHAVMSAFGRSGIAFVEY